MTTDVPAPFAPPPQPTSTQPVPAGPAAAWPGPPATAHRRSRAKAGLVSGCLLGAAGGAASGASTLTAMMLVSAEPGQVVAEVGFTVILCFFAASVGAIVGLVAGGILGAAMGTARIEHLAAPIAVLSANGPLLAFFVAGGLDARVIEGASARATIAVVGLITVQTAIGIVVGDRFAKRKIARRRPNAYHRRPRSAAAYNSRAKLSSWSSGSRMWK